VEVQDDVKHDSFLTRALRQEEQQRLKGIGTSPCYRRILLVNPPYPGSMERGSLRAGLGYIAEMLEQANIEFDVFDMELGYEARDLKQKVETFCPDLIGVSMMTYWSRHNYGLLKFIKTAYEIPIVVGGPHISGLEEAVLRECHSIDYGIIGEGEQTIIELCLGQDIEKIGGLIYRRGGDIIVNPRRKPISELDQLPFPKYRRFELDKYVSRTIPIVSSRGCPYHCIFCTVSTSMGKKVRARSPANVVNEIEYWYEKGQRRFGINDDNFTFHAQRVFDLCDEIERRGLRGLGLLCINGVRADSVSRELLQRMKEVGFCSLGIGVEAGNDRILKTIKKGESIGQIEKAIQWACELGYEVTLHFVVGTPGETWEDIQDSFSLAQKYPVRNAYFNNLMPYPGAELYEWVVSKGYFVIDPAEYFDSVSSWMGIPVFETPELSREDRERALKEAVRITREVRKRYYRRKFRKLGIGGEILGWATAFVDDLKSLLREGRLGRMLLRVAKRILKKVGI